MPHPILMMFVGRTVLPLPTGDIYPPEIESFVFEPGSIDTKGLQQVRILVKYRDPE